MQIFLQEFAIRVFAAYWRKTQRFHSDSVLRCARDPGANTAIHTASATRFCCARSPCRILSNCQHFGSRENGFSFGSEGGDLALSPPPTPPHSPLMGIFRVEYSGITTRSSRNAEKQSSANGSHHP